MRKLLMFFGAILIISSCKKDDNCISSVENDMNVDVFYKMLSSCGTVSNGSFIRFYKSEDAFFDDTTCYHQPIPIPLNFDGIILAQGVKVPYVGPNGGDPGYTLDVAIKKDTCDKFIDFKFILTTIDTSRIFEHNENVLVLLNGVDSTYTVNFSHEIIPFKD